MTDTSSMPSQLEDFLSHHMHKKINMYFGDHDSDGTLIIMNGTLIGFDGDYVRIWDVDGADVLISLRHLIVISEGWSDDGIGYVYAKKGVKA